MENCKICGKECSSIGSIATHIRYSHLDYDSKKYYDEFLKKNENEGICLECGKPTRFYSITGGYSTFCCPTCSNRNKEKNKKARETFLNNHKELYEKIEKQNKLKQKRKRQNKIKRAKIKNKKIEKEIEKYGKLGLSSREKIEITCLRKYGTKSYVESDDFKNKAKLSSIKHYGTEYPTQSKQVKEKIKTTNLERYGVENSAQNKDVIEKTNETKLKKNLEFQEKGYKQVKDLIDLYGYGWFFKQIVPIVKYLNHGYVKNEDIQKIVEYHSTSHFGTVNCISNKEKEIVEYIKSICKYNVIENARNIIKPFELDIYIPDLNIAFEFNGDYWHNSKNKSKFYHINKTNKCLEKGIMLFHIFESEWKYDKDNIKTFIKNKINKIREFNDDTIELDLTKHSILEYPEYEIKDIIKPFKVKFGDNEIWNCGKAILIKHKSTYI